MEAFPLPMVFRSLRKPVPGGRFPIRKTAAFPKYATSFYDCQSFSRRREPDAAGGVDLVC